MAGDHYSQQLGEQGEGCPSCGAPLAHDQRYCLECGYRRAASRVPYADLLTGREAAEVLPRQPAEEPAPDHHLSPPLLAGAIGAAAVLVLALGLTIGLLLGGGEEPQQVAAAAPQKAPIINITNTGGGAPAEEEFVEDWPTGKSGWTIQLEVLPKDTADVAAVEAAKADAEAAGATDVGALDSDSYTSLEPGAYVVYSGVFTGKGAKGKAQAALKKLKKKLPDAKLVKVASTDAAFGVAGELPEEKAETVDDTALEDLESASGIEQQKKSAQLPDTLALPGDAPPEDKAQPGGGDGGGEVIE